MAELFEDDIRGRKADDGLRPKTIPERVGALHRNTRGYDEVVVKVTSYTQDRKGANAHADYVSRRGEEDLTLETSDGLMLQTADEVNAFLDQWFMVPETRKDARRTANIVLSSPAGSDVEKLKQAVRAFSADFFGNHESMFVIHRDTNNLHAHLTVKTRGFDGKQLRLGKAGLKQARDNYAGKLREQGIQVNASYRSERGLWTPRKDTYRPQKPDTVIRSPNRFRKAQEFYTQHMGEYLGAARYLREKLGLEKQAQDLEEFARELPAPTMQESRRVGQGRTLTREKEQGRDDLER